MKNYQTNTDRQFTVNYAVATNAGYGHKKIEVELEFEGNFKIFNDTTSFMPGYDAAMGFDGQEKYEALYELIDSGIEQEIEDWIETL